MAHELTIRPDGRAEGFFAGDGKVLNPAWHGLGVNTLDAQNSAAAIVLAGLDWSVVKAPAYALTTEGEDNHFADAPDFRAIVRTDCNRVLGYVTDDYSPVQNAEAFAFLDSLNEQGIVKYESAGSLRGGRKVWMLVRTGSIREVAPGDHVQPYLLFTTGHGSGTALQIKLVYVRVVCANTLAVALGERGAGISVRHDGNVHERLDTISLAIRTAMDKAEVNLQQSVALVGRTLTNDDFVGYLDAVLPLDPNSVRPTHRIAARESVEWNFYSNPRQNMPGIERSAWSAYNAVSEFADHEGKFRSAESRFVSIMEGGANELKRKAFALALDLV